MQEASFFICTPVTLTSSVFATFSAPYSFVHKGFVHRLPPLAQNLRLDPELLATFSRRNLSKNKLLRFIPEKSGYGLRLFSRRAFQASLSKLRGSLSASLGPIPPPEGGRTSPPGALSDSCGSSQFFSALLRTFLRKTSWIQDNFVVGGIGH